MLSSAKFAMQDSVQLPVKCCAVRAAIKHRQIIRVLPVLLVPELLADGLMEFCPGQRIRNRNADIVRLAIAHHFESLRDVFACFTRKTELEKEAYLDAGLVDAAACFID